MNSIVSDTGPLITLEKLENGYEFIKRLYSKIVISTAVFDELTEKFPSKDEYIINHNIENFIEIHPVVILPSLKKSNLHRGEAEAISLSMKLEFPLLIEESYGRTIAMTYGIDISGIARQIAIANQKRIISYEEAINKLNQLLISNRINHKVFNSIIKKLIL